LGGGEKKMQKTDFGLIGKRINKEIDFSTIENKADYINRLKLFLRTTTSDTNKNEFAGRNLLSYLDELYEKSDAPERITAKLESEQKRISSFLKRLVQPDTKTFTKFNNKRFAENPKKYLLDDYDYETFEKGNIKVVFNPIYGFKQYKDLTTGRYTKRT
jgi:hypothetical protein